VTTPSRNPVRSLPALSLEGKRAFITGSGTGLGRMIALGMCQAGADVVLVGRRREPLEKVAGEVEALGGRAEIAQGDITVEEDVVRMAEAAAPVDILVNNVGMAPNQHWRTVSLQD
jgi:NAD(P)-dependent dehydrogenase (short-subunit alcohol dehydrogenase family)